MSLRTFLGGVAFCALFWLLLVALGLMRGPS
jgi:hypothetical protein